jgi:hypothetical protein
MIAGMRRLVLSSCLALACAPQVQAPTPTPAPTPAPASDPEIADDPGPGTTMLVACGPPRPLTIDVAVTLGEHAGKRWAIAQSDEQPAMLLHLGPAGELLRTPLPRWTEHFTAEAPGRLRMLAGDDPAVWWTVDLRDPDDPLVSRPTTIAGLTAGMNLKGFAADPTRALVSDYRRGASDWEGETWLLGVPEGQRIGPGAPATTWTARCANGRCYGWADRNGGGRELLALADAGPRTLAILGADGCTGAQTWDDGGRWIVAWSERAGVGFAAIDLAGGPVQRGSVAVPGSQCPGLEHLVVGGRHGLVVGEPAAQKFVAVGPDLRPGPLEPLPTTDHQRRALAGVEAGVLAVETSLTKQRVDNGVDPGGKHEWQDEATFRGRHGLLVPDRDGWRWQDGGPLPHDGEVTTFGDGHDLVFLSRPGHAGVLMLADPGDAATWLRLHGTCP